MLTWLRCWLQQSDADVMRELGWLRDDLRTVREEFTALRVQLAALVELLSGDPWHPEARQ
jgi:hypothetical protein